MLVRTTLLLVAASASHLLAQAPPATAPATSPATQPQEVEEVRLSAGRAGEYDAMIADLGLEGAQLEAFKAKDAERVASLSAFVEGEEGKQLVALREQMAAARRERRTAEVAPLRARITPLSDRYWAVRNEGRRELLRTLTEPQLTRVAGAALYARVARGLPRTAPSDEQRQRTRAICDEAAAAWFKMSMLETDPYFREITPLEAPTRERVLNEVFTPEQRNAMKRPSTRASR